MPCTFFDCHRFDEVNRGLAAIISSPWSRQQADMP